MNSDFILLLVIISLAGCAKSCHENDEKQVSNSKYKFLVVKDKTIAKTYDCRTRFLIAFTNGESIEVEYGLYANKNTGDSVRFKSNDAEDYWHISE